MSQPQQIAQDVYAVDAIGIPHAISVLLVREEDGWTLVDTGIASSAKRIREALETLGSGPESLKRIVLTHQHDDHVGGLQNVLQWAPRAEIYASAHESEVISGRRGMDPQSNGVLRYLARNAKPPGVPVGHILQEGETVAGFRIIATPGHSPGHISLLRQEDNLLFTADAFGCLPFKLRVGVRRAVCVDPAQAKRSAQKLLEEDFDNVYFTHGKPLLSEDGDPKTRLRSAVSDCDY